MKKCLWVSVIVALCVFLAAGNASATLIGGPSPVPGFGNDSGSEIFAPSELVVSFEFYDVTESYAAVSGFGFYFTSSPSTMISIFDALDLCTSQNQQVAAIDFNLGVVSDMDSSTVQTIFTPQFVGGSLDNIGFWYGVEGLGFVFTQASMNGGADAAATFPSLTIPDTYLLAFEQPDSGTLFSASMVGGIKDASAVPEPATSLLLGSGLAGLALYRRKRNRK